jgi:Zn-dependent protease with chaperone function
MANRRTGLMAIGLALALGSTAVAAGKADKEKVNGYLDFRDGQYLIVDGQKVATDAKTKFTGGGKATSIAAIPIGYEVKAKGVRQAGGVILATEIEANRNGQGNTEKQVLAGTDQAEKAWVSAGKIVEPGPDGKETSMGKLITSGPQVDRARGIVDKLLPAYVDPRKVRVYVVENPEWNAMAMANYSIYVFSGLMNDMDDDELAIVLGHELTHATYEHSRRQASKSQISGIAGQAALLGAEYVKNPLAKGAAQQATQLGVTTFGNAFSREYEDQADRVGLRYVYEAGYEYRKGPALWRRFAQKYGDQDKVSNFFFGDHSLSAKRAKELEEEIANNYSGAKASPAADAKK